MIFNYASERPSIEYSNFISNDAVEAVLDVNSYGMIVKYCIFRDAPIALYHGGIPAVPKYELTGCWFSGTIGSTGYTVVSQCFTGTTALYAISGGQICSVSSCPPRSRSSSPQKTPTRSKTFSKSLVPSTSFPNTPSESHAMSTVVPASLSPMATISLSCFATVTLSVDQTVTDSPEVTASVQQTSRESPTATLSVLFSRSGSLSTSFQIDQSEAYGCTLALDSEGYGFDSSDKSEQTVLIDSNAVSEWTRSYHVSADLASRSNTFLKLPVDPSSGVVSVEPSDLVPLNSIGDGVQPQETTSVSSIRENSGLIAIVGGLIGLILLICIVAFLLVKRSARRSKEANSDPLEDVPAMELPSESIFGMTVNFASQYQDGDAADPLEVFGDLFADNDGGEAAVHW
jgi:hypothetical protein